MEAEEVSYSTEEKKINRKQRIAALYDEKKFA